MATGAWHRTSALASLAALALGGPAAAAGDVPGSALPALLPQSTGATFYVAPEGSDRGPGSLARPWRTVQHALDRLRPAQRALVRAGVYAEGAVASRSGTAAAPITLAAY